MPTYFDNILMYFQNFQPKSIDLGQNMAEFT